MHRFQIPAELDNLVKLGHLGHILLFLTSLVLRLVVIKVITVACMSNPGL